MEESASIRATVEIPSFIRSFIATKGNLEKTSVAEKNLQKIAKKLNFSLTGCTSLSPTFVAKGGKKKRNKKYCLVLIFTLAQNGA